VQDSGNQGGHSVTTSHYVVQLSLVVYVDALQVRLPVRCEALLRLLLQCVRGASSKFQRGGDGSSNALRAEMYVCLIQYMQFCRYVPSPRPAALLCHLSSQQTSCCCVVDGVVEQLQSRPATAVWASVSISYMRLQLLMCPLACSRLAV
jgi:hypothetical protein